MSDETPNPLEGLLDQFALGPAWARGKSDEKPKTYKEGPEREYRQRRRDDGGNQRRGNDNRGRRDEGRGRRFDKNKRGPYPPRREEIAPAEGVNVSLFPHRDAIKLICKEIHQVARVYSLFDIAQTILSERERMTAQFEINEKKPPFFACKFEDAIYLTKEEALSHLLKADWRDKFIEESTIEIDPPKGNYQSVAKCGLSGEWLGPPNYHGYQTAIRRLHRERFSHLSFEAYSAKVRTERSEEAVAEWIESMKTQTRWRVLTHQEIKARLEADKNPAPAQAESAAAPVENSASPAAPDKAEEDAAAIPEETVTEEEIAPAAEASTSEETDSPTDTIVDSEETPQAEDSAESTEESPSDESESEKPAESAPELEWFTDRAEMERALSKEVLNRAFKETRKARISAAVSAKYLSPGLLVRLKGTSNHHRKHPAIIIPSICRVLEYEHMAVFKRKGKLFTGPARPNALSADAVLAPRPAEMVKWIKENSPAKLEGLWKAVLPEGSTAPPQEYAADLYWLLQQGHILLYTDDTLVVQEQSEPAQPKKEKPKTKKKESSPAPDSAKDETPEEIVSDAIAVTAGLVMEATEKLVDAVSEAVEEARPEEENADTSVVPASSETSEPREESLAAAEEDTAEPTPHPEPSAHNVPEKPEASEPLPPAEPQNPEDETPQNG